MSANSRRRIDDLLLTRAIDGLSAAETQELEALLELHPRRRRRSLRARGRGGLSRGARRSTRDAELAASEDRAERAVARGQATALGALRFLL